MRILIISDIHSNHVALDTVLKQAGTVDRVWCLGDVVGYGPEPNECIATLSKLDPLCLAGNHDWVVTDRLDSEEFNSDARRAVLWTRERLTVDNLEWLHSLPERVAPQLGKFTLVHGSPRHPIWEYVLTPPVARANFSLFDTPVCLMGHTHVPVIFHLNASRRAVTAEPFLEDTPLTLGTEKVMINPGSVGQPRDGDPRASYALLETETMTMVHHRVDYDIRATQAKMEQAQLPSRLIARLTYGW